MVANSTLTPQYYFKYPNRINFYGTFESFDNADGYMQGIYLENCQTTLHSVTSNSNERETRFIIIDKKSGNYFVCKFLNSTEKQNQSPWFCKPKSVSDDGYFISVVNVDNYENLNKGLKNFFGPEDYKILSNYNPDDNPILLLFKYKSF